MEILMVLMSLWIEPPFVYNGAGASVPTGTVEWPGAGALLVWLVVIACVGLLLGILYECVVGSDREGHAEDAVHHEHHGSDMTLHEAA